MQVDEVTLKPKSCAKQYVGKNQNIKNSNEDLFRHPKIWRVRI